MAAPPSTASHSSSSSSSSFSYSFTYDVFLRFRDPHTPHDFLALLYKFLRHKGISTFIHGEEKAADLSGNDFKLGMNGSIECVVVEKIVRWVSRIVSSVPLHGWDCPVGQKSRAKFDLPSERWILWWSLQVGDLRNGWSRQTSTWKNNTCSSSV